ncbi:histone-like nucleoid-structuring protein Lsr2 [Microbacterium sp. NPDC080220]|uniref:Lsr2 family DNA-binding protein n=1 Tax=Microbacterium sp. NPDC080220 TaxID=3161017 RepID=UPI0034233C04
MSGADRLEDGFPHGTVQGYDQGCRGGWCPEGNDHGLSCAAAKRLNAGDYRYQRLVKRGLTPGAIADELGLAPETHQPPTRKPVLVEDTDDVVDVEPEEPIMRPTPESKRDQIRAWAEKNGIPVKERGRFPNALVAAYEANDPKIATAAPEPKVKEPRPLPEHGTDARYQRGCHDELDCPGHPQTAETCRGAHRAKIREAARRRRERLKSEKPADAPVEALTHDEAPETGTPASEAHTVGEHASDLDGAGDAPVEGAYPSNAAQFATMWNGLTPEGREELVTGYRTATERSLDCYLRHHTPAIEEQLLTYIHDLAAALARAETAEGALALTLVKWEKATHDLADARTLVHALSAEVVANQAAPEAKVMHLDVQPPSIDPHEAAEQAIAKLDRTWWRRAAS